MVLLEKRLANRFSNNTIGNYVCQDLSSGKSGRVKGCQEDDLTAGRAGRGDVGTAIRV